MSTKNSNDTIGNRTRLPLLYLIQYKVLVADYIIDLLIKRFLYRVTFRKTEYQTVGLFRTRNSK